MACNKKDIIQYITSYHPAREIASNMLEDIQIGVELRWNVMWLFYIAQYVVGCDSV